MRAPNAPQSFLVPPGQSATAGRQKKRTPAALQSCAGILVGLLLSISQADGDFAAYLILTRQATAGREGLQRAAHKKF